jgi:hypothetical protein
MISKRIFLVSLFFLLGHIGFAQQSNSYTGPKWRVGLNLQYATSFKNVTVEYTQLGYTGILGGYTGRGLEILGGYRLHKYLVADLSFGVLFNQYSRTYDYDDIFISGRFNKVYVQPGVKFIYPLLDKNWGTLNIFTGGGLGFHKSGRMHFLTQAYGYEEKIYLRYNPMIAPYFTFGTEINFSDRSILVIGFKYQTGEFDAKDFKHSGYPSVTIKDAPDDVKSVSGQGLGLFLGVVQEF